MNDILMVVNVVVLFLLRIGLPVLVLVTLGTLIDRWQKQRESQIEHDYSQNKSA